MRRQIRVRMVNWVGLEEAGVDGGGIFREFLSELLQTALDPSRGFFAATHEQLLYPNPLAPSAHPDIDLRRIIGGYTFCRFLPLAVDWKSGRYSFGFGIGEIIRSVIAQKLETAKTLCAS
ncbi:unnamed protein product [Gongylonema pulchrum]|uniref:HECT-type E3 ubiquitin transferase n=1 Tax=Gongylonema pulchrum TaxID=637853 RepID=A0A3P6RBU9_9BILA|nr:unnamed protein product [Gongylonema pulchrum]